LNFHRKILFTISHRAKAWAPGRYDLTRRSGCKLAGVLGITRQTVRKLVGRVFCESAGAGSF
jgi:hypothetical protein